MAGGTLPGGGVGQQQSGQGKLKTPQDGPQPDSSSSGCWLDTPLTHFRSGGGKIITSFSSAQLQRSGSSAAGTHPLATAMAKPDLPEEQSAGQLVGIQCIRGYLLFDPKIVRTHPVVLFPTTSSP